MVFSQLFLFYVAVNCRRSQCQRKKTPPTPAKAPTTSYRPPKWLQKKKNMHTYNMAHPTLTKNVTQQAKKTRGAQTHKTTQHTNTHKNTQHKSALHNRTVRTRKHTKGLHERTRTHTNTRTHKHTNTQAHTHTNTQTHEHTNTRTHKHTNPQTAILLQQLLELVRYARHVGVLLEKPRQRLNALLLHLVIVAATAVAE